MLAGQVTDLGPPDEPVALAPASPPTTVLGEHERQRAGWLGHLRSFVGVNAGLAAINLLTGLTADSLYPWFLYVTASWGMGLVIHGLTYRGWVKDHEEELRRARVRVEQVDEDDGEGRALPGGVDGARALPAGDGGWGALVAECDGAVEAAKEALAAAEIDEAERVVLEGTLERSRGTVEAIRRSALAVRAALADVAPNGTAALDGELTAVEARIAASADDRLRGVYEVNRRLLEARRDKVRTLEAEQERMEATVKGFLIAAQNVRLDAARLGAGGVPNLLGSLEESLSRLDDEVELARQVEIELDSI